MLPKVRDGGGGRSGCDYKEIFMVTEYFCILIVVLVTQIYTCDEMIYNTCTLYNVNFLVSILHYNYVRCNY